MINHPLHDALIHPWCLWCPSHAANVKKRIKCVTMVCLVLWFVLLGVANISLYIHAGPLGDKYKLHHQKLINSNQSCTVLTSPKHFLQTKNVMYANKHIIYEGYYRNNGWWTIDCALCILISYWYYLVVWGYEPPLSNKYSIVPKLWYHN